ncbi:MAG: hypothetical protein CMJ43_09460 [Phyllobacteriaceae bacterium]|nr:hypothetical protein [Phyllobacteriaceae bacterium]
MRVFLTGMAGFSGGAVATALARAGHEVTALLRAPRPGMAARTVLGDLTRPDEWRAALDGQDAVIHLAAFNPPRLSRAARDEAAMTAVNVEASVALARAAVTAGVSRFVFASSVRVYGFGSTAPFREDDPLSPDDPYARSKAAAEASLREIHDGDSCALAILRLPVIHGPGRGGWLGLAARLGRHGWLFPPVLGQAPKSVLNRDNLAAGLAVLMRDDAPAVNGIFNLADDGVTSLEDIGRLVGKAAGHVRMHVLPGLPGALLDALPFAGAALAHARRPCVADTTRFAAATGWTPPVALADGLAASFAGPEAVSIR